MSKPSLKKPRNGGVQKFHPFFDRKVDLDVLAAEQGVSVITNVKDLRADFWPEDETLDEFLSAIRSWRDEKPSTDL